MAEQEKTSQRASKFPILPLFVLTIAVAIGVYTLTAAQHSTTSCVQSNVNVLTYWPAAIDPWNQNDNLRTIKRVFDSLGYQIVNATEGEKWDVFWSLEFPFDLFPQELKNISEKCHINHIPGISFITNKKFLAVYTQSKYIPPAFDFPRLKNEFLYYQKMNASKMFVVKNFDNRGVKIVPFHQMNYHLGESRFVQEFISNPLLIDGHAFDFGVYVLITSINPLRIYRWKKNIFLRFCPEAYHPFDPQNVDKYVVSETHKAFWEVPKIARLTENLNYSAMEALNYFLLENGHEPEVLWEQVDDAIVSITLSKESMISRHADLFRRKHHGKQIEFFELLRFDFIIDDEMKLHLMEINMSPNLTPTNDRDERHSAMYEQVVYNTITMLGITKNGSQPNQKNPPQMMSDTSNIVVSSHECMNCLNEENDMNCFQDECQLCMPCLPEETIHHFHRAYIEHQGRGAMKRIFPTFIHSQPNYMEKFMKSNEIMVKFFKAKCEEDEADWC